MRPGLEAYEYSLFSQNGEDGILRYLFAEVGFHSRRFVEFGFGASQNNSLRLILKENMAGLFIDGAEQQVAQWQAVASRLGLHHVQARQQFLSLDNLADTLQAGLPKVEIDFLSIDVDGNDYWFWQALDHVSARIVVIEYNASLGPEIAVMVPYDPHFDRLQKHPSGMYCGASLRALETLGKRKGYRLVGCDSSGVNAFFVREDCLTPALEKLASLPAYRPHRARVERGLSEADQEEMLRDLPWVTVTD